MFRTGLGKSVELKQSSIAKARSVLGEIDDYALTDTGIDFLLDLSYIFGYFATVQFGTKDCLFSKTYCGNMIICFWYIELYDVIICFWYIELYDLTLLTRQMNSFAFKMEECKVRTLMLSF